jgi:hypothetical protein
VRKRKASVTDIRQWRLWRQIHPLRLTGEMMRAGIKYPEQSFPIQRPYDRRDETKPKGRAQIIPFRRAG